MWFTNLPPKKFLCRYSLQKGSLFVGIFMFVISLICVISLAVELLYFKKCAGCPVIIMHNAYSFSINALIYCIFMACINAWFVWGVKYKKSSVVLSWVVITGLWWAQSVLLVFVLLCLYITDTSLGWLVTLASVIIGFMIFAYFILVGYGYWLEIRKSSQTQIE